MANVCVIIPWRGGCAHRQAALHWTRRRWPWPTVLGECKDGPWVKAKAVADGLTKTDADVLVIADADVWCPTDATVGAVLAGHHEWGFPHRVIRRLTEEATVDVLLGGLNPADAGPVHLDEPETRAHAGGGILVIRREVYEQVPFDARFEGWGYEDDALGWALWRLVGHPFEGAGTLVHLWHPPQERPARQRGSEASCALLDRYWSAQHNPAALRALVNEGRLEVTP